jgi:ketosteroid isomerase-like protein
MSKENVDKVKRAIAALNARDSDRVLADFHPDVEWRDLMHAPDVPERVRGVAAVRSIMDQWDETFDEFTAEIGEYIDAGDRVVCVTQWHAKGKGSGVVIHLNAADVYEFRDGRIAAVTQGYPDKAAALEAARLSE